MQLICFLINILTLIHSIIWLIPIFKVIDPINRIIRPPRGILFDLYRLDKTSCILYQKKIKDIKSRLKLFFIMFKIQNAYISNNAFIGNLLIYKRTKKTCFFICNFIIKLAIIL